jgi:ubiquinone biosynthesis protein UbiJ
MRPGYNPRMATPSPLDALKPLAGRALEAALNRVLALDPDTQAAVAKLDGRRIALALEAPAVALEIHVDGGRLRVGPANTPEPDLGIRATLAGALGALPFLRPNDAPPVGRVRIAGDAELARALQQLARGFDPDWSAPFAQAFGPILGPQVARTVREGLRQGLRLAEQFGRDAAEYVTEESRDIIGKAELAAFHDDVDALRDRAERVAARIARLGAGAKP